MIVRMFILCLLTLSACKKETGPADAVPDDTQTAIDSYTSAYTELDLSGCEVLETHEESKSRELLCMGYRDTPLYITEGDGRYDVDAGAPDKHFVKKPSFNSLGDKAEWRLKNGEPIAVIIRYYLQPNPANSKDIHTELAVISIANATQQSCYIAWVKPSARPSQNDEARKIADHADTKPNCVM